MIAGAQLYTLRDFCKTTEDLENTLRRVAQIGYKAVQLSGVCEYDAVWMRDTLKKYGLVAPLTHTAYKKIIEETDKVIEDHITFGAGYVGLGSMPNFKKENCSLENYEKYCAEIAPAVEKIAEAGLKFMYHNHNMEFIKLPSGKALLEDMAERFDPEKYGFTLDTYWVQAGGGDPAQWLKKLAGRIDTIHFKDMIYNGEDNAVRMAPVGWGNINHIAARDAAQAGGTKYVFVEQDRCYDEDPFDCMKKSYDYLKEIGLE